MKLFYRSYQQLTSDMHAWELPDFAAICGVPRSGIIPATILALRRNLHSVPLSDLVQRVRRFATQNHYGTGRNIPARDGPDSGD